MPHNDALVRPETGSEPELTDLRSEIDRIDDALLALIEQRFSLSRAIATLKQDGGGLCLRPRREREILDRLAGRAAQLPGDAVNAIWRELMGLSVQAQQRTILALHSGAQPELVTNLARLRFGCAAPIVVSGSPAEALDRARRTDAVAIIELSPLSNWWVELHDERSLVIFDGLREEEGGRICALAIGRLAPEGLLPETSFPILSEAGLHRRLEAGERIRTLAISGPLRLCIAEGARLAGGTQ